MQAAATVALDLALRQLNKDCETALFPVELDDYHGDIAYVRLLTLLEYVGGHGNASHPQRKPHSSDDRFVLLIRPVNLSS